MFFSVGAGGAVLLGGGVVVVVVVVVVVDGACFSLFAHPAIATPIASRPAPAATTVLEQLTRFELMIRILSVVSDLSTTKTLG